MKNLIQRILAPIRTRYIVILFVCSSTLGGDLTGDFSGDGVVNMYDYSHVQRCLYGPGYEVTWGTCLISDLTQDQHIDLLDVALFQSVFDSGNACTPQWASGISQIPGVSGIVHAMIVYNGELIIGGEVYGAGGTTTSYIAKWNGDSWSNIGTGIYDYVHAFAVFDDGSGPTLFACGLRNGNGGVARWNGTIWEYLDGWFSGTVNTSPVYAMTVFDGGNGPALYVGGKFTSIYTNGKDIAAKHIAKWDGQTWSEVGGGVSASVRSLQVYDDGAGPALFVGGYFNSAGGVMARRIAKWDGAVWSAIPGADFQYYMFAVHSMTVFDAEDGPKLYFGVRNVYSWDGATLEQVGGNLNEDVKALGAFDDGAGPALYAGGWFPAVEGNPATKVVRWNGDDWVRLENASLDNSAGSSIVHTLVSYDSGRGGPKLYVGGEFTSISGMPATNIAIWDTSTWSALNSGIGGYAPSIQVLEFLDDGNGPTLFAGGRFKINDNGVAINIARRVDNAWVPLGDGIADDGLYADQTPVRAITVFDDGTGPAVYAGGDFLVAGGVTANHIAKWDGENWSALGSGFFQESGAQRVTIFALASFDDGTGPALYAGGEYITSVDGVEAMGIVRWGGVSWEAIGSPSVYRVRDLLVFDDGSGAALYAGGSFFPGEGVPGGKVAKWNGSTWLPIGSGLSGSVYALGVYDDGTGPALVAGGSFNGDWTHCVAKWTGNEWIYLGTGFDGGFDSVPRVYDLAAISDENGSTLYACGNFTLADGNNARFIAKWNGTKWSSLGWSYYGAGVSNIAHALANSNEGLQQSLFVGGEFDSAGGAVSAYLAEWISPNAPCPP